MFVMLRLFFSEPTQVQLMLYSVFYLFLPHDKIAFAVNKLPQAMSEFFNFYSN